MAEFISIGEALSPECQRKLMVFVRGYQVKILKLDPDQTVRQALKERVLQPHWSELKDKWDIDYLSFMLCHLLHLEEP
jgi:hypothetical protein